MATDQSTDDYPEPPLTEEDYMDDWVQYTYETYGSQSPEYQAARIKSNG